MVRGYSQYHEVDSQKIFDPESQSFFIESQIEETEGPIKLDFQAEYLKCMGFNSNDIENYTSNAKANYEQNTEQELNSQTDVEANLRTYMTGNPHWNQDVTTKVRNH